MVPGGLLNRFVIPCVNVQRPILLWIPEIFINKNPEIKTHAYMQAVRNKMAID
jgi:hypothetical protein